MSLCNNCRNYLYDDDSGIYSCKYEGDEEINADDYYEDKVEECIKYAEEPDYISYEQPNHFTEDILHW